MTYPPPGPAEPTPPSLGQPGAPQPSSYGQPAHPGQPAYPGQPAAWGPEQGGYPPYGVVPPRRSNALAITGLVLAIVGLVLCLIPIINLFAAVLALAGLVLGIVGLVKAGTLGSGKGMSIAAIVISVVAGIGVVVSQIFFVAALDELSSSLGSTSISSSSPDETASDEVPADGTGADVADPAAGATSPALAFGDAAVYEDGLEVGVSAPAAFTPSDTAAGDEGFTQFVRIDVTLTNGTADTFDPTLTYVTISSGGAEGAQVFDAAHEISSTPSAAVLPGQSVTFPVVFGVTDPADLTMEVNVGAWEYDAVVFSTTG